MQVVLTVIEGPEKGQTFTFDQHDHFFVGRAKVAHFRMPEADPYFSRLHLLIEINPPACRLLDLGSTNGTKVNGRQVQSTDLQHGDLIAAGDTVLRVAMLDLSDCDVAATAVKRSSDPHPMQSFAVPSVDRRATVVPSDRVDAQLDLPGYELRGVLGRGSMGIVYRAVRLSDRGEVAVKVIQPKVAGNATDYQRFLRETEILRRLEHPAIVRLIEVIEVNGLIYFSMELVEGVDARTHAEQSHDPLSVSVAVGIISRALAALEHAHEHGFVHRDVKPGNILLGRQGKKLHVKMSDFGLARAYAESKLSGLTLTGDICGTPNFMAPEQITDCRRVKPAADQYSAAASLYWLLSRHYTHDFTRAIPQVLNQILLQDPVPLAQRRADLPQALVSVIHRALQKDPAARYASVAVFRQALQEAIQR